MIGIVASEQHAGTLAETLADKDLILYDVARARRLQYTQKEPMVRKVKEVKGVCASKLNQPSTQTFLTLSKK